jgi:hypothetical protein
MARADGMGMAAMGDVVLAGFSLVGCVFYLAPASIAGVVFFAMRGKPRSAARSVLGILALVLAIPGQVLLLVLLAQDILRASGRSDHELKSIWFVVPPLLCAALLAGLGVLLLRADRAAPPSIAKH